MYIMLLIVSMLLLCYDILLIYILFITFICYLFSVCAVLVLFFFFKQKTAYEMRISDWSSDVCSSDLSLASYQLEVLRDKNRELTQRLHDLYAIAQENERLAVQTQQLTLNLLRQDSAASTVRAMAARLSEDFNGDLVRVVLFEPVQGLDDADWLQVIPRD